MSCDVTSSSFAMEESIRIRIAEILLCSFPYFVVSTFILISHRYQPYIIIIPYICDMRGTRQAKERLE